MPWAIVQLRLVRHTLLLIAFTIPGLLLFLSSPSSAVGLFGLIGHQPLLPWRIHTLFSYALIPGDLGSWLLTSVSILCTGVLLERLLATAHYYLLVAASAVLGGVTFYLLSEGPGILLSANHVAWGLGGTMLIPALTRWSHLRWLARLFVVWIALTFLDVGVGFLLGPPITLDITQFLTGMFGVGVGWWSGRHLTLPRENRWPYEKPVATTA